MEGGGGVSGGDRLYDDLEGAYLTAGKHKGESWSYVSLDARDKGKQVRFQYVGGG